MGPAFSSASGVRARRSFDSGIGRARRVSFVHFTALGQSPAPGKCGRGWISLPMHLGETGVCGGALPIVQV